MSVTKDNLLATIDLLKSKIDNNVYENICNKLNNLAVDIKENAYNIIVMGEFKRGKSTFINALIGKELLPTDVLPETTTINALRYGSSPRVRVHYRDGRIECETGDTGLLKNFSAQNVEFDPENINFVDISYPSEYLSDGIMIIDTPGVSDINQQRCEITYGFVPKANAVLFLLDATSPLKKTEVEFIEDRLLNIGIDNIIFILNKYDLIDEEEDDDIVDDTVARIKSYFTSDNKLMLRNLKVLPLSAKDALMGQVQNKESLYKNSGMVELKNELITYFDKSKIEEEKIEGFVRRLRNIIKEYIRELLQEKSIQSASIEELQASSAELVKLIREKSKSRLRMSDYVDSSIFKINEMARKSLGYFSDNLEKDLKYELEQYKHTDFKSFLEGNVVRIITKRSEQWFSKYNKNIDYLLNMIDIELSKALSKLFEQRITLQTKKGVEMGAVNHELALYGVDYTDEVNLLSGAIAGGGAVAIMMASSVTLMPFLSLAVFPVLRSRFQKQKIEKAKEMYLPEIISCVNEVVNNMNKAVQRYTEEKGDVIKKNCEAAYDTILNNYKLRIEAEINKKEKSKEDKKIAIDAIDEEIMALEKTLLKLN